MKNTIAVCISRMEENFQTDSLKAICKKADECGLSVQIYNVFEELANHDLYDKGEESIFELINYERLCGIILFIEKIKDNELNNRIIEAGKKHGIPVVSVDRYVEDCYSITFDYAKSFEQIVRHLIEVHKCRRFFVMGGFKNNTFSDERIQVVRQVLSEYDITLTEDDIGYGDFWEMPCRETMKAFLDSGRQLPDAFIAANDTMAITICDVLVKAGYHIPKDTIVTGFDGIEMERYVVPRLTTAQQNIELAAEAAVEIIDQIRFGNREMKQHHVIPFEIRYSQSCGCQPVVYSSVSAQINQMYNTMTGYRQFNKFMYEMIIDMTSEKTLSGMIRYLERYFAYLTGYRHIYVCINRFLMEGDDELMQRMEQADSGDDAEAQDMLVLCEYHEDSGFCVPLTKFLAKEQLPDYDHIISKMKHVIFVPLHMQDMVFGYMVFDARPEQNVYYQINSMSTNLSHCMDSVRQKQKNQKINEKLRLANEKLEELYVRDPLTGIYNRRGFYQELEQKLKNYRDGWLMLVSVDLDGLKQVNDQYGHSEGDFAIKAVGESLANCCEENGICARFGGDEFTAALFYNEYVTDVEQKFKQTLMDQIAKVNMQSGKEYQVGASCGAGLRAIDESLDLDMLLKAADNEMYNNKEKRHAAVRSRARRD